MKAYVLAAGYATRLYPLTRDRAKPLLEVAGAPIVTHLVDRLLGLDALREIVVIGNRRFHADFVAWRDDLVARRDDLKGVALRVLDDGSMNDDDKLGAIGDIAFALREAPTEGDDLVVVAGDNLLDFDLVALQRAFVAGDRKPLLALRDVPISDEPTPYNEVTLDERGRVTRFREKPPASRTGLAAIALYFLPGDVAPLVGRYLEAGGNPDAPGHFIAWLVDQTEVRGVPFEGAWHDIGSLETLERARHLYPASRSGREAGVSRAARPRPVRGPRP